MKKKEKETINERCNERAYKICKDLLNDLLKDDSLSYPEKGAVMESVGLSILYNMFTVARRCMIDKNFERQKERILDRIKSISKEVEELGVEQ